MNSNSNPNNNPNNNWHSHGNMNLMNHNSHGQFPSSLNSDGGMGGISYRNGNQAHHDGNNNNNYGAYVNPGSNSNGVQFQRQRFGNDEFARRFASTNANNNIVSGTSNYDLFQHVSNNGSNNRNNDNNNKDNNLGSPYDHM